MAFECYGLITPWKIVTVADQQLGGCPAPSVVSGCSWDSSWAASFVVTNGGSLSLQSVGGTISSLAADEASTVSVDATTFSAVQFTGKQCLRRHAVIVLWFVCLPI